MRSLGWSRASNVLGSLLLLLGILAGLVNRQVLDGQRFAHHVDDIRRDPAVARQVGEAITNSVLANDPDLIALRPLIESTSISLAASTALTPIVRLAARQVHQSFTESGSGNVVLRLVDVGAVLTASLSAISPAAAAHVPPNLSVTLAEAGGQSFAAGTIHLTYVVGLLAWLLPLLALLSFGAGLLLAPQRLRGTMRIGYAIVGAGAGVGLVALFAAVYASVADENTFRGAVIAAGWRELGGIFWRAAAVTVLAGGLVVAAASARLPEFDPPAVLGKLWSAVARPPRGKWARIGHGAGLIVVGTGALFRPRLVLDVVAGLIGIVLLVAGFSEVASAAGARRAKPGKDGRDRGRWGRWTLAVGLAVAVALVVGLVVVGAAPSKTAVTVAVQAGPDTCNGHVELCDRRYNDVAFPAAHNAMSAADEPGWFIPEQPQGVIGALEAGVSVLLIDSYYGQSTQTPNLVATAPQSFQSALTQTEQTYGASVVASARRVRDSIAARPTGPVAPYLCHGLCEIGSTPWEPLMVNVRAWLDAHPREVVTFFIQDYVSPADTAKVFGQAGLLPYVYTQKEGQPWPTLGQMIDSGKRVVVLMENHGGGKTYPWMLQGFDWVQDTAYTNPTTADLTCALNRGAPSHPLLLINNWLSGFTSLVTNAKKVNAIGVLGPYLQKCRTERGQLPNFVAVNFYNEPDVFKAVDQLNGFS